MLKPYQNLKKELNNYVIMETWEFVPYKAVGPIYFGANKKNVEKTIGKPTKENCKHCEKYTTDSYVDNDLFITYEIDIVCQIDHFYERHLSIRFKGIELTNRDYKKIMEEFQKKRYKFFTDKTEKDSHDYALYCLDLGIFFYFWENLKNISFFDEKYRDVLSNKKLTCFNL